MSRIIDVNGHPMPTPSAEVQQLADLPHWCHGVSYRADDDIITIRVVVPDSQLARSHVLALEAEPAELRVLVDALTACLNRSQTTMRVLDVPSEPSG